MKVKTLIYSALLIVTIAGILIGVSLYLQPDQSILGITVIVASSLLGAAAFISGLNDSYDFVGKLQGERNQHKSSFKAYYRENPQNSGQPTISNFSELAHEIWPLMAKNGRAYMSFGPNSGSETAADVRWDLELWENAKIDIVLPNNERILKLIEENGNLVPIEYQTVFNQMAAHIYAFKKHCQDPNFSYSDNQFPPLFGKIIDEVCVSEESKRGNLLQYEQWLNERFDQINEFEILDAYIVGSALRGHFTGADIDLFILTNSITTEEIKISLSAIEHIKEKFLVEFGKPLHVMTFTSSESHDYYDFLDNIDRKKQMFQFEVT